jgi:hypothetical protein
MGIFFVRDFKGFEEKHGFSEGLLKLFIIILSRISMMGLVDSLDE